jgi:probable HAF family extracellular repeat protein
VTLAAALAAAGLFCAPAHATTIYNLGTLGGGQSSGLAINDSGQVVGDSWTGEGTASHPFIYSGVPGSGGTMYDLGTFGGSPATAFAINAGGQVAGFSQTPDRLPRAFLYTGAPGSGTLHNLGTLGGLQSFGSGINSFGHVTGRSETSTSSRNTRAFIYTGTPGNGGSMRSLGTLGGGASAGVAINDVGQVAGSSWTEGNVGEHAFLYTPGDGMRDLGTLGGLHSFANGINASGQVAGYSGVPGNAFNTAFLYTGTPGGGGTMLGLGTLGGTNSFGMAINDSGNVVGRSLTTFNLAFHAFLYTGLPGLDGQMIDLDQWLDQTNPGEGAKWTLSDARGINDSGLITGTGVYNDGPGGLSDGNRAFLLDASALTIEPRIIDRTAILLNQPGSATEAPFPNETMRVLERGDASPVGVVQEIMGLVIITRPNGDQVVAQPGTLVHMNDVIETDENGSANLVLSDESTYAVPQNARLGIDEYVYNPDAESGASNFNFLREVFVFTSELIGRDDDNPDNQPVGWGGGIRGDASDYINWDPLNPAAELRSSSTSTASATSEPASFSTQALTETGSVTLYTSVEVPDAPFELSFDYSFVDSPGMLEVTLDGVNLLTLTSENIDIDGMYRYTLDVTDPALLELLLAELAFTYHGDDGSIFIDNVTMPGVNNGDFGAWDNGWFSRGPGQVDLVASVVPEPAGLFLLGLLPLLARRGRLRHG